MAPNTTTASTSTAMPNKTTTTSHDAIVDFFLDQLATIQSRFDEPELDKFDSEGKPRLAKSVRFFLDCAEPIQLVLPAFPFKSPNKGGKVLGALPDRGEELALLRLEQFCQTIETVYPTGCTVTIFSDGRVFNDLLGVSTEAMAAYKVELRAMAVDAGHTHIHFDGLEHHTTTSDPIKEVLDRFHVGEMDMNALIKQDAGLLNTYRSFRKFLEKDLAHKWKTMSNNQASKQIGDIAKQMMHRNVGFSTLVDATYPHTVRLSIHLYDNAGPKFGIHLTPHTASNVSKPRTPWHSVICEDLDGSVHKVDLDSVDLAKYELVEKRGRPWGFRERAVATATATEH
jgi:pyoverdine/dityrosine biosynthesis protein Dit1